MLLNSLRKPFCWSGAALTASTRFRGGSNGTPTTLGNQTTYRNNRGSAVGTSSIASVSRGSLAMIPNDSCDWPPAANRPALQAIGASLLDGPDFHDLRASIAWDWRWALRRMGLALLKGWRPASKTCPRDRAQDGLSLAAGSVS